ncbi:PAS domain S-box protein [Cellvibrio sp.]|uniref:PAS domain S-box protein n=1 Tax=Cellvibrio sp. TaxID=1965322 RepID=UPI0039648206
MPVTKSSAEISWSSWLALGLIAALIASFTLYVLSEKQVDRLGAQRHQLLLYADELRQSSDDLTRMVRSYAATGNPIYKEFYQDIIAIRDGKLPRPKGYHNNYWHVALANGSFKPSFNGRKVSLLELMRESGASDMELRLLNEAKTNSDTLNSLESQVIDMVANNATISPTEQSKALDILHGEAYDRAKANIIIPIDNFYNLVETRTLRELEESKRTAYLMRLLVISLAASVAAILWRISSGIRTTLGGSVYQVYEQISRLGKGDFTGSLEVDDDKKNSILGWLEETQRNLLNAQEKRELAEIARSNSDARYKALFANIQIGIVIFVADPEKALVDANECFCDMLGYSRDEISNLLPKDVVAEAQHQDVEPAIDSIKTNDLFREWLLKRKDGSLFTAEVLSTKMPDGTMMSMVRDISARKIAEEKLRASEQNLAITLQSIGDAVIVTDTSGAITRMNPTAERLTGWPLTEARGKPLIEVFRIRNAQTGNPATNPVELVIAQGKIVGLANGTKLHARDGSEYQIADSAAPIRDAEGKIVGVVLVFSDVTARYESEAAVRRADERLRRTFKLIPNPLTLQDPQGVMIDCSDAFCDITGFSRAEIIGRNTADLGIWVDGPERETMRQRLLAEGRIDKFEMQLRRRDGSIRIMQLSARYLTADPEPLLLGTAHDITDLKLAEEAVRQNERFIATLAHNIPGMVSHWTTDLLCNFATKAYANWYGKTPDDVYRSPMHEVLGESVFSESEPYVKAALAGMAQSTENMVDGKYVWSQYIPDIENGKVEGLFLVATDITKRKHAELALQESVLHTQAILDNMFDGVITINTGGQIESFNVAASRIFGYAPEEVMGKNVSLLMPGHFRARHEAYLQRHETEGGPVLNTLREVEGLRKNGEIFPMSLSITKVLRADRTTFVGLVRDISQQRQDEEEIYRLAFYDPLTNLPNRRLLYDRLQQAMITSSRTDQHGALMFLDLDYFKQLNDSLGHDLGDILLQQVASRLQSCVREGDSVARMGGDEFVMLMEALSPYPNEAASQAEMIADKVLHALSEPYKLREYSYLITPSIGIVLFWHQTDSIEELLKKADVAMYQAKTAGRNTARFFDPTMQAAVSVRVELEKNMRMALTKQEFLLHYQLQVDRTGKTIGVEALLRWKHSEHGMISPAAFIPLAEETGMILPIGQWVLETACMQLVEWARSPETATWCMSVNVSIIQFSHPDFVANVKTALQKTGANPHYLKLELTESMLAKDVEEVIVKMVEIKSLGVTFSLDDFGTGYSSLSYLKRLPLDQLKIDQSFVRDLLTDPNDATIARTIVALGHSLGLSVIAEGVETAEQRNVLAEMGCDAYQGYYFARPTEAEDLDAAVINLPDQHQYH